MNVNVSLPEFQVIGPTGQTIPHAGGTLLILCNGDMHRVGTIARRDNYVIRTANPAETFDQAVARTIRAEYELLGIGVTELATALGISPRRARRRWDGETQYTVGQIIMAGEITELSTGDWARLIFAAAEVKS